MKENQLAQLESFAKDYHEGDVAVKKAAALLNERQDGELVTRVILLLNDPHDDTWDVEQIRHLRQSLGRKATALELPPVSLTLVAESELKQLEDEGVRVFA